MKQTDVIDKYLEFKAAGNSEDNCQLLARSWAECQELHPEAATRSDLQNSIKEIMAKIDAKFFIVYTIGAAIFAVSCVPILTRMLGH